MLRQLLVSVLLLLPLPALAGETWRITSLEWPPYSGQELPEGGAGIAVLRAALKAEGIELEVSYYPWMRAMATAREPRFVGVFPIWPEDVPQGFSASPPLFKSPVGFVEPRSKPLKWDTLDDLKGMTIGTVQGYGNTREFMQLIENGTIRTEVVVNDLTNVRKVAAGRIDGAFIDLVNLDYYLRNDGKSLSDSVQANAKPVGEKPLLLAIDNNFENKDALAVLSRGMSKIDSERILKDYLKRFARRF